MRATGESVYYLIFVILGVVYLGSRLNTGFSPFLRPLLRLLLCRLLDTTLGSPATLFTMVPPVPITASAAHWRGLRMAVKVEREQVA
jgi:hypothetical protein